jgi:hypothetical protein
MHKPKLLLGALLGCLAGSILVVTPQPAAQTNNEAAVTAMPSSMTQRAKPAPTLDLPVTDTIADYIDWIDGSTGLSQRYWMQIRSDGAGTYTNSSSLVSIIQGASGDWILDSKNATSPSRTFFLDFTKPIPGTGPNGGNPLSPFSSALVYARLISKCHEYNNDMLTIPVGVTVTCPLAFFFSSGGSEYFLQMNPGPNGADLAPETDLLNITCNAANGSLQCNNWTIAANGSKGGCLTADCSVKQNVTRLSLRVPVKGKSGFWTTVNQGDFYVAFSIMVTNP